MKRDYEEHYWLEGSDLYETPPAQEDPTPWGETRIVGTRRPRVDAYERVSGSAKYPSDIVLPRMLYGAILRCPHPHARVLGVDAGEAETMPGVRAVLTGFGGGGAAMRSHRELLR